MEYSSYIFFVCLCPAASGTLHIRTKGPGCHEKRITTAVLTSALPLHALPSCAHLCRNCGPTSVHGVCALNSLFFFCIPELLFLQHYIFFHHFPLRFPSDPASQTVDGQFLWGSSLLISPVLERGAVEVAAYLPSGTWYSLHNVSQVCGCIHMSLLFNRIQQGFTVPARFILMFI